eukprot:UN00630
MCCTETDVLWYWKVHNIWKIDLMGLFLWAFLGSAICTGTIVYNFGIIKLNAFVPVVLHSGQFICEYGMNFLNIRNSKISSFYIFPLTVIYWFYFIGDLIVHGRVQKQEGLKDSGVTLYSELPRLMSFIFLIFLWSTGKTFHR